VPDEYLSIQAAVTAAEAGDTVEIRPGLYTGRVDLQGKGIVLMGRPDRTGVPIIENPGDFAISCTSGEGPDTVLKNLVIRNSFMACFIVGGSPTLHNLTVVDNYYGIEAYGESRPDTRNCIFWDNIKSDLYGAEAAYNWSLSQVPVASNQTFAAFWDFDKIKKRNVPDAVGDQHGWVQGAKVTKGISGQALNFDGIDDSLDLGLLNSADVLRDLGFAAWVYPVDHGILVVVEGEPVDFGGSVTNGGFYLKVTHWGERDILFYAHEYGNGINQQHDFPALPWERWTHIAVVRDAGARSVRLYYDGLHIDTYRYARQAENPSETMGMTVGARSSSAEAFAGKVDEIALFGDTISQDDVKVLASRPGLGTPAYLERLVTGAARSPLFVNAAEGDYHLRSERGRFSLKHGLWVLDAVSSPAIDGGDPNSQVGDEPSPHGDRINAGAYGGTPFASMSNSPR
jgi:hypothetical protein